MRWVQGALGAAAAVLGGFASAAGATCTIAKFAEFPVTMMGTAPMMPAKVNGVEVQFEADSGAFFSMISPGAATQLHLHRLQLPWGVRVGGVGGDIDASFTVVRRLGLSTSVVPDVQFIVGGSEMTPPAIGLIGQNVWGIGDVEYDLGGGVIRMFRAHGCGGMGMAYWAESKPFSALAIEAMGSGQTHTIGRAQVDGKIIRVAFDTGASASVLSVAAARRAGIRTDGAGVTFAGYSGGIGRRLEKTWIAPVDSFRVGQEEIKNTRLRIGEVGMPDIDMLLGADFFLSHRVYVANSQQMLYFTYNGGPVFDLRSTQQASLRGEGGAPAAAGPDGKAAPDAPTDAEGFSRRGSALAGRGEYLAAIDDFTHAMALAPQEPRYAVERARARMGAHQPFLAMADLDAALKLKGDDAPAHLLRATLRIGGRDRPGAMEDLDAASAALPRTADQRFFIGEAYLALDAFDPAIGQFDQWIDVHDQDRRLAGALNSRCWARALANQALDRALSDCNRAVRTDTTRAAALDSRGLVHLRRGEYSQAISDYDGALALRPKLAWSLYGRGVAELKSGDKAKGDADLAAAAETAPTLAERAAKLGVTP